MNVNVNNLARDVRDIRYNLDTQPPRHFADNAVLTGLLAELDSERSMSRGYEEYILRIADLSMDLREHFSIVQQLHYGNTLTSHNLDEFISSIDSILEVNSSILETINDNCSEREVRPSFN